MLQINPGNDRARFELARLLAERGDKDAARAELETILSHGVKDENVRRRIDGMLADLRRGGGSFRSASRIEAGVFHDDNVNIGPDSENIRIAPIIFGSKRIESLSVKESSRPREADGAYLMVMGSGTYDAGSPGGWAVICQGGGYANALDGEHDHEVMYVHGGAGLRLSTPKAVFQSPVSVAHINSGGEPLANVAGITPSVTFAAGRESRFLLTTSVGVDYRDYDRYDARDGLYLTAGGSVRHISENGKIMVALGLTVSRDEADEAIYCADGLAWHFSVETKILDSFSLYGRVRFAESDYDEKEPLAPERRTDRLRQFVVGVSRMITAKSGIDVNYQDVSNESTFDLYEYTRHVTSAGVFWAF